MLTIFPRFYRTATSILTPPFSGLWLILLSYYTLTFLVCPDSQLLKGNLPDPDDYMYLTQVIDWLNGQGWYDNIQYRLNPPDGVMIHFSRLTMLPMAALIFLFKHLGLNLKGSAIVMAAIYPLLLFAGFFAIMRWVAGSFMPKEWTGVTAYIAIFSLSLICMFNPGHVDHHGLMIMVVALALGCALRMMEKAEEFRWGLATGAILAIGMVLALEILPWVLIISIWLGLWAAVKGRTAAYHGFFFGVSLCFTSVLGLLLTRLPDNFFTIDPLTYSIVYVFLSGGIMAGFAGVACAVRASLLLRVAVGAGIAAIAGAFFFHRFPELIIGPYGAMDPQLASFLLKENSEGSPLIKTVSFPESLLDLLTYMPYTLLALAAGSYLFKAASAKMRWLWGLLLSLLLAAFLLTTFYQLRFNGVMEMLAIIPLAVLLQRSWSWAGSYGQGTRKNLARIGVLLLVAPFPAIFLPAPTYPYGFVRGLLLFPVAASYEENVCDTHELARALNDPAGLGDRPRLILNDINEGPELLFRTRHSVLAAPFNDVSGNLDVYRFFSTTNSGVAEDVGRRRHADLVVSCTGFPVSYLQSGDGSYQKPGSHFIERIITLRPPDWLQWDNPPGLENFVIYKILPPRAEDRKSDPVD